MRLGAYSVLAAGLVILIILTGVLAYPAPRAVPLSSSGPDQACRAACEGNRAFADCMNLCRETGCTPALYALCDTGDPCEKVLCVPGKSGKAACVNENICPAGSRDLCEGVACDGHSCVELDRNPDFPDAIVGERCDHGACVPDFNPASCHETPADDPCTIDICDEPEGEDAACKRFQCGNEEEMGMLDDLLGEGAAEETCNEVCPQDDLCCKCIYETDIWGDGQDFSDDCENWESGSRQSECDNEDIVVEVSDILQVGSPTAGMLCDPNQYARAHVQMNAHSNPDFYPAFLSYSFASPPDQMTVTIHSCGIFQNVAQVKAECDAFAAANPEKTLTIAAAQGDYVSGWGGGDGDPSLVQVRISGGVCTLTYPYCDEVNGIGHECNVGDVIECVNPNVVLPGGGYEHEYYKCCCNPGGSCNEKEGSGGECYGAYSQVNSPAATCSSFCVDISEGAYQQDGTEEYCQLFKHECSGDTLRVYYCDANDPILQTEQCAPYACTLYPTPHCEAYP